MDTPGPYLTFLGLLSLILGLSRYYGLLFGAAPTPMQKRGLLMAGVAALATSLAACTTDEGWRAGGVTWLIWLSVSGLLLVFLLPWLARRRGS